MNGVGQLGRAVKAIDSKSIGVTRVSSNLTAVDLFSSPFDALLQVELKDTRAGLTLRYEPVDEIARSLFSPFPSVNYHETISFIFIVSLQRALLPFQY